MAKKQREPVKRKGKISDFVDEACGEFESLQEEMQNWYDSMPESLQGGDKGSRVEEAATGLEEAAQRLDFPEGVDDEEMEYVEYRRTPSQMRKLSRSDRRDDAVSILAQVVDHLQGMLDALGDNVSEKVEEQGTAIEEYMGEVQNLIDNAEAVEFPGMYG